MAEYNTPDEIIDFAIEREEEAYQFYTNLAGRMEKSWMRKVFEDFAKEEMGHKQKLQKVKDGETPIKKVSGDIPDLKMADYLIDVPVSDDMDYQDALIVAMKKEKAAFRLYMDLADFAEDKGLRATLIMMAQEEAKHKLRFEVEYDDNFADSKY